MGSNDAARRIFVVRQGRLVDMPKGMVMMVPSDLKSALASPLFSLGTKWRMLREYSFRPRSRAGDFSIEELISHHFGSEAVQYLAEPLLSGVYGGSAARLSAPSVLPRFVEYESKYGSLIRGVQATRRLEQKDPGVAKGVTKPWKTSGNAGTVPVQSATARDVTATDPSPSSVFLSFKGGMQTLIDSLAGAVAGYTPILHTQAEAVRPNGAGWLVETGSNVLQAEQVVLACPAHQSAALLSRSAPTLAALLSEIPYSSSVLITLLFRREEINHPLNGFGFLVPPPERRTIAAATWINTKFPSRVAADMVAIRAFLVDPEAGQHLDRENREVIQATLTDLQQYMGIHSTPLDAKVYRWPNSMPQYVVGHSARVSKIQEQVVGYSGLHLSANFLDGVGIPDCVRRARTTAARITR